jgi:uncharacterized protein YgbK (DUF1537 family)
LGRTIKDGKYFIRGKLIHKTEFAHDPAHPRKTADVVKLLGNASASPVQVCKLNEPLADAGVILCESMSPGDVQAWAKRVQPEMLPAGGAEFFAALLGRARHSVRAGQSRGESRAQPTGALYQRGLELFVCGTMSKSSQKFVRTVRRAGTPVFSLPKELAGGSGFTRPALKILSEQILAAFQKHTRVILQTGLPPVREIPVAQRLATHLTQLAAAVLSHSKIARVYVEGGATAVELARQMSWTRFTVLHEVAPGVTTLAVTGNKSLQLTIKPGSYVWPAEIQKTRR